MTSLKTLLIEDDYTFNSININNFFLFKEKTIKEHTVEIILHYLKKNRNNVLKTAKKLNIGMSNIYNLIL
jgi:transcriptional regulator with PAS, ATPase and Fis domain